MENTFHAFNLSISAIISTKLKLQNHKYANLLIFELKSGISVYLNKLQQFNQIVFNKITITSLLKNYDI